MRHLLDPRSVRLIVLLLAAVLCRTAVGQKDSGDTISSIGKRRAKTGVHAKAKPAPRHPVRRTAPAPAHPVRAVRPKPPAVPQIVVSALGQGQTRTIAEAVQRARPGTRILVRSGVYRESLIVDKPLEIVGEQGGGDVFVESSSAPCLRHSGGQLVVRGLVLRERSGVHSSMPFTVDIARGRLVLESCELSGGTQACLAVHGTGTEAVLRYCRIHDGGADGVRFTDHAAGTMDDCEVSSAPEGVLIDSASPTIRHCRVHDCRKGAAFDFDHGAQGLLDQCEAANTAGSSIYVRRGSAPTIRGCKVHDTGWDGVQINDDSTPTVEDCEAWKAHSNGLSFNHSSPTVRRCLVHECGWYGIWSLFSSRGLVEDCEVASTQQAGITISDSSNTVVRRCRVHGCAGSGFHFYARGTGTLEACEVWECGNGINLDGCEAAITGCHLHDSRDCGVWVGNGGHGMVEQCDFARTAGAAIMATSGGEVTAHKCVVRDARNNGIWFWRGGHGSAIDCDVSGCAYSGVAVTASDVTVRICRLTGNGGAGVWVNERGRAEITNCTLSDNHQGSIHVDPGSRAVQQANRT